MKPALLLVSRRPDALVGRLCERFDCHLLAELDDAGLEAWAPRLCGIVATGEPVVTREPWRPVSTISWCAPAAARPCAH